MKMLRNTILTVASLTCFFLQAQEEGVTVKDQKIGINNTTPNKTLEVSAADNPTLRLSQGQSTSSYLDIIDGSATIAHLMKITSSGNSLIDLDPRPLDGVSQAAVRLFRSTNTTDPVSLQIMEGINAPSPNHMLAGNRNSYMCRKRGNLGIGVINPLEKLHVEGNLTLGNHQFFCNINTGGEVQQVIGLIAGDDVVINRSAITNQVPSKVYLGVGPNEFFDIKSSTDKTLLRMYESNGRLALGTTLAHSMMHICDSNDPLTGQYGGLRFDPAKPQGEVVRTHDNYHRIAGFQRNGLCLSGSSTGTSYTKSNIYLKDEGIRFGMSDGFSDPEQRIVFSATNTGNVGVGTKDPYRPLHVVSSAAAVAGRFESANAAGAYLRLHKTGTAEHSGAELRGNTGAATLAVGTDGTGGYINFRTGTEESMRISETRMIGIGTETPTQKLHIYGAGSTTPSLLVDAGNTFIKASAGATSSALFYKSDRSLIFAPASTSDAVSAQAGNSIAIVGQDAKMGIGTWSPTQKLEVVGNIKASGSITPSDRRLKYDIQNYDNGLNTVLGLNPVTFKYNGKGGTLKGDAHIGLIAQEVNKYAPELINYFQHKEGNSPSTKYMEIKDSELIYLLINSIQELNNRVEEQHAMLLSQKKIIDEQASLLEQQQSIANLQRQNIDLQKGLKNLQDQMQAIKMEVESDGRLNNTSKK